MAALIVYMRLVSEFICCLYFFLGIQTAWGQLAGYVHYDETNGLAGSTVYAMCQDKEGFLWIGTSNGLSRYDGVHFMNFSTQHGLSDNEVLHVFCDSQNRIWIASFTNALCYYAKGKIHTASNDPLLRKIRFEKGEIILGFWEDSTGTVHIESKCNNLRMRMQHVYKIKHQAQTSSYPDSNRKYVSTDKRRFLYQINNKRDSVEIISLTRPEKHVIPIPFTNVSILNDSILFLNTENGAYRYNFYQNRLENRYLAKTAVHETFQDIEGNLWFSTLEDGLYQLGNSAVQNFTFQGMSDYAHAVYSIQPINNTLYIATNTMWRVDALQNELTLESIHGQPYMPRDRCFYLVALPNGHIGAICQKSIYEIDPIRHLLIRTHLMNEAVKDGYIQNAHRWLLATSNGVCVFNPDTWQLKECIWSTRATSVAARNDSIFIGTLNGLYVRTSNRTVFLGETAPILRERISKIYPAPDGSLWIATYGHGVAQWKNGRLAQVISESNGLSNNSSTVILADENRLWVGTNKGLNKVTFRPDHTYSIEVFNTHSGLISNAIRALYKQNDTLYIGTSRGLSSMSCMLSLVHHRPRLLFAGATDDDKPLKTRLSYKFIYARGRHIRFEFRAISFQSGGSLNYHYRLQGLDSQWRITAQPFLDFTSLPAGSYTLELFARNGFHKNSQILRIPFQIVLPWWLQRWAQWLIGVGMVLGSTGLIYLRFQRLRAKTLAEGHRNWQMIELKHRALKAQLNPHFVFNCLNSIQQFLLLRDTEQSNKYLTTLARLMRQTMEITSRQSIPVHEEITYLTRYLDLERMRFDYEFDYQIDFDSTSPCSQWHIPSMIIQPYVENSIRHGIRYKEENNGWIQITVTQTDAQLAICITDNGIGRQKSETYKSNQHIEYQSKGTSLTQERLDMLNKNYVSAQKAQVEIRDLYTQPDTCAGTQVILTFPIELLNHLTHDSSHTY